MGWDGMDLIGLIGNWHRQKENRSVWILFTTASFVFVSLGQMIPRIGIRVESLSELKRHNA